MSDKFIRLAIALLLLTALLQMLVAVRRALQEEPPPPIDAAAPPPHPRRQSHPSAATPDAAGFVHVQMDAGGIHPAHIQVNASSRFVFLVTNREGSPLPFGVEGSGVRQRVMVGPHQSYELPLQLQSGNYRVQGSGGAADLLAK